MAEKVYSSPGLITGRKRAKKSFKTAFCLKILTLTGKTLCFFACQLLEKLKVIECMFEKITAEYQYPFKGGS